MTLRISVQGITPAQFAAKLRAIEPVELSQVLAEEGVAAILDGFEFSQAPDGTPWAELSIRDGNPLEDTGGLRNAWATGEVSADGFELVNGKEYADYHQRGTGVHGPSRSPIKPVKGIALKIPGVGFRANTKGAPARPMVPEDGADLPQSWADRFDAAVSEYLDGVLNE